MTSHNSMFYKNTRFCINKSIFTDMLFDQIISIPIKTERKHTEKFYLWVIVLVIFVSFYFYNQGVKTYNFCKDAIDTKLSLFPK